MRLRRRRYYKVQNNSRLDLAIFFYKPKNWFSLTLEQKRKSNDEIFRLL